MLKLDTIIMEEERAHNDANTIIQIKHTKTKQKQKTNKQTNKQTTNKQTNKQNRGVLQRKLTQKTEAKAHQVCRRVLVAGRVSLCCQLVYMRTTRHTDTYPRQTQKLQNGAQSAWTEYVQHLCSRDATRHSQWPKYLKSLTPRNLCCTCLAPAPVLAGQSRTCTGRGHQPVLASLSWRSSSRGRRWRCRSPCTACRTWARHACPAPGKCSSVPPGLCACPSRASWNPRTRALLCRGVCVRARARGACLWRWGNEQARRSTSASARAPREFPASHSCPSLSLRELWPRTLRASPSAFGRFRRRWGSVVGCGSPAARRVSPGLSRLSSTLPVPFVSPGVEPWGLAGARAGDPVCPSIGSPRHRTNIHIWHQKSGIIWHDCLSPGFSF